jgi:hypothetical protein
MKKIILAISLILAGTLASFAQDTQCPICCVTQPVRFYGQIRGADKESQKYINKHMVQITHQQFSIKFNLMTRTTQTVNAQGDYEFTSNTCSYHFVVPHLDPERKGGILPVGTYTSWTPPGSMYNLFFDDVSEIQQDYELQIYTQPQI